MVDIFNGQTERVSIDWRWWWLDVGWMLRVTNGNKTRGRNRKKLFWWCHMTSYSCARHTMDNVSQSKFATHTRAHDARRLAFRILLGLDPHRILFWQTKPTRNPRAIVCFHISGMKYCTSTSTTSTTKVSNDLCHAAWMLRKLSKRNRWPGFWWTSKGYDRENFGSRWATPSERQAAYHTIAAISSRWSTSNDRRIESSIGHRIRQWAMALNRAFGFGRKLGMAQ